MISGNWQYGVRLKGTVSQKNQVQGNRIGRDSVEKILANTFGGILIDSSSANIIGEEPDPVSGMVPDTGSANIISGNGGDGVRVQGANAVENVIRRNRIYENKGLGINLVGNEHLYLIPKVGVTPNDARDVDSGPNSLMNFPVGVTAYFNFESLKTYISGVLDTPQPEKTHVDIYANENVGWSGFGEGQIFLGTAIPDEQGNFVLEYIGILSANNRYLERNGNQPKRAGIYFGIFSRLSGLRSEQPHRLRRRPSARSVGD